MAMPTPARNVPAYRGHVAPPASRRPRPTATQAIDSSMEAAAPSRAAIRCANGANRPMHSTGSVVSAPERGVGQAEVVGDRLGERRHAGHGGAQVGGHGDQRQGHQPDRGEVGAATGGHPGQSGSRVQSSCGPVDIDSGTISTRLVVGHAGEHQQVDDHRPDLRAHHLTRQPGGRVDDGARLADPLQPDARVGRQATFAQLAGDVLARLGEGVQQPQVCRGDGFLAPGRDRGATDQDPQVADGAVEGFEQVGDGLHAGEVTTPER